VSRVLRIRFNGLRHRADSAGSSSRLRRSRGPGRRELRNPYCGAAHAAGARMNDYHLSRIDLSATPRLHACRRDHKRHPMRSIREYAEIARTPILRHITTTSIANSICDLRTCIIGTHLPFLALNPRAYNSCEGALRFWHAEWRRATRIPARSGIIFRRRTAKLLLHSHHGP
jgi:hypothetical protein